jgi:hypothetical protein
VLVPSTDLIRQLFPHGRHFFQNTSVVLDLGTISEPFALFRKLAILS